jgi:DNA-binding NtrC family response regulator
MCMSKTILVAATDPNIVYLLQRYAEESGFQAVCSDPEKELLQLAQQVQPVLIVLQIEPPEAVWRQSLQCLKSDPHTGRIPVVAYSCFDEVFGSPPEGIAGFLQKSVLYSDFVLALEQAGVPVDRSKRGNFNPVHKGI